MTDLSESDLDDIVHDLLDSMRRRGVNIDSDLMCDLNDNISDFLTDICEINIIKTKPDSEKNLFDY